jgi:hypothetical protein
MILMVFNKGAVDHSVGEWEVFSTNGTGETRYPHTNE